MNDLQIREIYDLIEPRKHFVYTDQDMLEVIRKYIQESELSHKKEISRLERDIEFAEDENCELEDENRILRRTIYKLEKEISEIKD